MSDRYEPASDFLKSVIAEEVPLSGGQFGQANLRLLIALTRDEDLSNRDWATLLLSQQEIDTPEVRAALLLAAQDENDVVRAEALLGLARRDRSLALPFAVKALSVDAACMAVFEAAELIAHPDLIESLQQWTEPSENEWLDELARKALAACQEGRSGVAGPSSERPA